MDGKSRGWSPLGRSTLALGLISFLLVVAFIGHLLVTGVGIPYQDPTPEQIAYERFHHRISLPLFLGSALSIFLTLVLGMAWILGWFIRVLRPK